MKVLHVIFTSKLEYGGPINALLYIARQNVRRGCHYTIVSMDAPTEVASPESGIEFVGMGPSRGTYGYNRNFESWLVAHAHDFDAVVVNGVWQHHSRIVHKVFTKLKKPYSIFAHGALDAYFNRANVLKFFKKQLYWWLVERRVIRDAKNLFFTSQDEKTRSERSFWPYRGHGVVVRYGSQAPQKLEGAEAFLEKFPELRGRRYFLFLSRIHPKKGCDLLLRAFATVMQQDIGYRLVLAGPVDESYRRELDSLIEQLGIGDRVAWTGMLQGAEKWAAFAGCEVFVLPSHQENFGVAVAEALSCGVPVLISNQVAIWHEIEGHRAGLVEADTFEGTRRLLTRWLKLSDSERRIMREQAKNCFDINFSVESAAADLLAKL